jgi:hypothetical protein
MANCTVTREVMTLGELYQRIHDAISNDRQIANERGLRISLDESGLTDNNALVELHTVQSHTGGVLFGVDVDFQLRKN